MEERLYKLYEDIDSIEVQIEEVETRIVNVRQQKISGDNIYQFLLYFDKLYDKFTDAEKKTFLNSFIEQVDIFEEEQPDGRILKHIKFRFPVYFNGKEIQELSWDNETTVETVVLLSHKRPDSHINVKVEFGEGEGKVPLKAIYERAEAYKPKERVTYKMIKEYIEEKYGFKCSESPCTENPYTVNPDTDTPVTENPAQLSTNRTSTETINKREKKEIQHRYGSYENVLLSDTEYGKLRQEFPGDYQMRVERLSEYMASTGRSYKNHLATIRSWAKREKPKYNPADYTFEEGDSL